jgi:Domain of unknown function (DUF4159)
LFDPYHEWLGIPPHDQPPNHYRLLGISLLEADLDIIDAAAGRQIAWLQACATGTRTFLAQRLVDDVAAARLCLLDPARKAAYDTALKRRRETAPRATHGSSTVGCLAEPQSDGGLFVSTVARGPRGRDAATTPVKKPMPTASSPDSGRAESVDVTSAASSMSTRPGGLGYGFKYTLMGAAFTAVVVVAVLLLVALGRPRRNKDVSLAPDVAERPGRIEPPVARSKTLPIVPRPQPAIAEAGPPVEHGDIGPELPPKEPVREANEATVKYHRSELGERVEQAIQQGVGYIKRLQRENGTWEDPEVEAASGGTSLAALALLAAGEKPDSLAIAKALKFLRQYNPADIRGTYAIALQTMVYAAAEPKRDRSRIAANVAWLERAQIKNGDRILWPGSWTYSDSKVARPGDASCSYFAVRALHAASEAGVPTRSDVWSATRSFWTVGQRGDGAWAYTPVAKFITANATCTGVSSWLMADRWIGSRSGQELITNDIIRDCGSVRADSGRRKGIDWLAHHFSVRENTGNGAQWQYYYLWALEHLGRLAGARLLGGHDWYRQGAEELVKNQNKVSGHWQGVLIEEHRLVATCFAVIFLANGRIPVLINKLRHGPGNDWDNDPHDVNNLVDIVSRDWQSQLGWQILDLDQENASDFSRAPILFFNGHENPQLSALAKQTLREYIEDGGFLFAEACCSRAEFDNGFRRLMKELFPDKQHELRPLIEDHPVWKARHNLVTARHALWGIRYGERTPIIYSSKDLSCYWNQANLASSSAAVIDAIRIGQNVVDYATGRRLPPDKLSHGHR